MTALLGSLGKILGLIDGNIDLGAITGIFGRITDLIEEGQALAKEFSHDPRLTAYFAKVRGLLKLPSGETITKEEIAALRQRWGSGNDQQVYDRPAARPTPPPVVPEPPTPTPAPTPATFPYRRILHHIPLTDNAAALLDPRDTAYVSNERRGPWIVVAFNDPEPFDVHSFGLDWELVPGLILPKP